MRLAIVRRRFAPAGGAERFITGAANALRKTGAEVTLVAESVDSSEVDELHWLRLPPGKGSRARRYRAFQNAVTDALSRNSFDIVQAHERVLGAHIFRAGDGVHAAWVARLKRERAVWRRPLIALDGYHRLVMETEQRMARETDTVFVANSAMVQRELINWLALPPQRVRLIENGVDLTRFRPAKDEERAEARRGFGLSDKVRVVAFLGSGFERKGAFALVRALADRRLEGVKILVAGRDKHASKLSRLADGLGLADHVKLLGAVGDVRPVLHAADLMVLPTLYDAMPNAALEAIACGLPVVTTADAGIADHIRDSEAGAVCTRDTDDLAETIAGIFARLEEARNAARTLRGRFALNDKTREWMQLYREFI